MMRDTRGKSRWTARLVLRLVGAAALAIVIFMALLGVYVLDLTASVRSFFIYWSVFFILLLSVITLAVFDTVVTIVKFRKEHARLREAFGRKLSRKGGAEP